MDEILRAAGVTDVYVCGIATDVCVGNKIVLFVMITWGFLHKPTQGHARTPDQTNKHLAP